MYDRCAYCRFSVVVTPEAACRQCRAAEPPKEIQLLAWDPGLRKYVPGRKVVLARPDQYGRRGGPVCAICGGPTRRVLDGEAWCDQCETYQ